MGFLGMKIIILHKPKGRKKTPSHGLTQVHKDRTKYNRKKIKKDIDERGYC